MIIRSHFTRARGYFSQHATCWVILRRRISWPWNL